MWLVLGDQLFSDFPSEIGPQTPVFMKEDLELCSRFAIHKIKIAFFLSAMRHHAEELRQIGLRVDYHKLEDSGDDIVFEKQLKNYILKNKIRKLFCYEISDRFFESRIKALCAELNVELKLFESPGFMVSRALFSEYLSSHKKPFMKTFYEAQRRRIGWLMDQNNKPLGGKFSFDADNRKPLPTGKIDIPELETFCADQIDKDVFHLVNTRFAHHIGSLDQYWIPTDRKRSKKWLKVFVQKRLHQFGEYEDAIHPSEAFLFHAAISPMVNAGLITPAEVVAEICNSGQKLNVPLNSIEGFVRQVMGWREFVFGIDQNFGQMQSEKNFWQHHRKLTPVWYTGQTGVPPLDDTIKKALKFAYTHHIERLMVVSSLMTLCEVCPKAAFAWFMEMYADSADWVMGPNVYGMGLFSDGGIFATKPYICGSNYYIKMGRYKKGDWCHGVDGLYWSFIDKHRSFYSKNPRTSVMIKTLDKMDKERKKLIFKSADELKNRITTT
jgi:deoxyribodipyrimidine photolyase-related protein